MRRTPARILLVLAILLLIALMVALAPMIDFLSADPSITRNYRDELAALMPTPASEADLALPLYLPAVAALGDPPSEEPWRAVDQGGLGPAHVVRPHRPVPGRLDLPRQAQRRGELGRRRLTPSPSIRRILTAR